MRQRLALSHRHLPGVTIIAVAGSLDSTTVRELTDYILGARQHPADRLVLDLTEVTMLNIHGLGGLTDTHVQAVREGGDLLLAVPPPGYAESAHSLRGCHHIPVHATVAEALEAALTDPTGQSHRAPET